MTARSVIAFLLITAAVSVTPSLAARVAATPHMLASETGAGPRVAVLGGKAASAEKVWQLRSTLNVAALMCADQAIIDDYNRLLRRHADSLGRAWQAEQQRHRLLHGANWQAAQDRALTRLYNRVANTSQRARFCSQAADILADARLVPPAQFAHFADAAAPRLERLFDGPVLAAR